MKINKSTVLTLISGALSIAGAVVTMISAKENRAVMKAEIIKELSKEVK